MKKTKVKILRNLAKPFSPYKEGQVVDCEEDEAQQLLAGSLAELVEHDVDVPHRAAVTTHPEEKAKK